MKAHLGIVNLPVVFLKEGAKYIAYTPALDLSTCGNTFDQAKRRFQEVLQIFIDELIKMGTLEEVLGECGWRKSSRPPIHWAPPVVIGQEQIPVRV